MNNPTYYGVCSNLRAITELAHRHNMLVLADEAHGTHFYFGENMPLAAMRAGADMASVSMHKSGGSLTQSSLLLTGRNVNPGYVSQIINLTQTTSASYLLLSSLDISRRNLALNGKEIFKKATDMAQYARDEINAIGDYYAYSREIVNGDSVFDFDVTKLSIHTLDIGDRITLTTKLGTRTYKVVSVEKISETDRSELSPSAENRLTLYTCVRDQRTYRWCVQAVEA